MSLRVMDWQAHLGSTVQVYRNLNNGRMSVQAQVGGKWKVVGHVTDLALEQISFTVRESGRQRVISQQQKNVHAFAKGVLVAQADPDLDCPVHLAYDPYRNSTFVERHSQQPIVQCRYLVVRANQVLVSPDALTLTPIGYRPVPHKRKAQSGRELHLPLFWRLQRSLAWADHSLAQAPAA